MAHATVSAPTGAPSARSARRIAAIAAWLGIIGLAIAFVFKYVAFYYRHYDADSFDTLWPRRGWLFLHINGGTLALLTGPWQFISGLRQRHMNIHRWTGRLFLVGVAAGIVGAVGLVVNETGRWAFGVGLMGLAASWLVTTGMAYYSIRKGLVALHKEWMIRAYVVTFAFAFYRIMSDYSPMSRLLPESDRAITMAWACWVVPLGITEMIFQWRRMQAAVARR